jgi:hypothetical protein
MSATHRALILSLVVAPLAGLGAQHTSATVDVGGTNVRYADSISSTGIALTPALTLEQGAATLGAVATVSKFASGTSVQGALSGSTFTPAYRNLSGELGANIGGSSHQDGSRTGDGNGFGRVHLMASHAGVWGGGGAGSTLDGSVWRSVRQADFGGWAAFSPAATVVATVTASIVGDTIRYTDSELSARWVLPSIELGATAGARAGSRLPSIPGSANAWGSVSVVSWISPTTAIVGMAGTYPLDYTQGFPAGKYVSVSLRFSANRREPSRGSLQLPPPTPTGPIVAFETPRVGGQTVFRVRAPDAQTLDIIGDFTQWSPVAMKRGDGGWWTLTIPVRPGTYQMNIRIEGRGWLVPPGLTSLKDDTGGEVGILIVPER